MKNPKESLPFDGLHWIVEDAEYLNNYRIKIWFRDGSIKIVDFEEMLSQKRSGSIFEPLKDIKVFAQVQFDEEASTITWPNGADIAPEYLYENGVDVKGVIYKMRA